MKNINKQFESLKKMSELVPNNTSMLARKYYSQSPKNKTENKEKKQSQHIQSEQSKL